MWTNPVGRVRGVGMIEGTSALILFFIAMPLKYLIKIPQGEAIVFWVGLIHGLLFITYAIVAFRARASGALSTKLLGLAAIAAIVPFGPFVLDHKLKGLEKPEPEIKSAELRETAERVS